MMTGENRPSLVLQDSPLLKHMHAHHRNSLNANVTDGYTNRSTTVQVPNLQRVHFSSSEEKCDFKLERIHSQCHQEPSHKHSHSRRKGDRIQCCRAGFSQCNHNSHQVFQNTRMRQFTIEPCRSMFTMRHAALLIVIGICLISPSYGVQTVSSEVHGAAAASAPNVPSFPHIETWNSEVLETEQSHSTAKVEIPDLIAEIGRLFCYRLPIEAITTVKVSICLFLNL